MGIRARREVVPFVKLKKVLILTLEEEFEWYRPRTIRYIKEIGKNHPILSFVSTQSQGRKILEEIHENVNIIFYDGVEHIRGNTPGSMQFNCELYMSYCHGPISQAIDMPKFKIIVTSTNVDKPKFCFSSAGYFQSFESHFIHTQIVGDKVETVRQCFGRIMRAINLDDSELPRVGILYGKDAIEVGEKVASYFQESQHNVQLVHCESSFEFMQELSKKWLMEEDINEIVEVGSFRYQMDYCLAKTKKDIFPILQDEPDISWREITKRFLSIREMGKDTKGALRDWFREEKEKILEKNKREKNEGGLEEKIKTMFEGSKVSWSKIYRKLNLQRKDSVTQKKAREIFNRIKKERE